MQTDEYYREKDPAKRGEILQQLLGEEDSEQNRLRREIYDQRYFVPKGQKGRKQLADAYMGFLLEMKMSSDTCGGFFGDHTTRRHIRKQMEKLRFPEYLNGGETEREILFQEFYHLQRVYLEGSLTDRRYGSLFLGLISMKEEQVKAKLVEDVYKMAYFLPRTIRMTEELSLWTRAAHDALCDVLPDCRQALEQMARDNQQESSE